MTQWSGWIGALVGLLVVAVLACGGDTTTPSTPTATTTAKATPTAAATATPTASPPAVPLKVKIVGSDRFVAQVEAALFLLADRAPEAFAWVDGSIATIFLTPFESNIAEDVIEGTVRVAQGRAFLAGHPSSNQVIWLAGELVYKACIINLYQGGGDYYSDFAAVNCLKEQIFALKRLERSRYLAGTVEVYLYGNYSDDLIESVPGPDY